MRVVLVTPSAWPAATGNAASAERWRRGLAARGHSVAVVAACAAGEAGGALEAAVCAAPPDLVHLHNAYRSGVVVLGAPGLADLPRVVSLSGTDVNVDLASPERRSVVEAVLAGAARVVVQSRALAREAAELLPGLGGRLRFVPKAACWFGADPFDVRAAAGASPADVLFFVPGGLRPVKGSLACLEALGAAHDAWPGVRALFAGPPLDEEYSGRFFAALAGRRDFATWLPAIPPPAMRSAYAGADVVVLPSTSEGMANVLFEASAAGRALLVSDAPSNRAFVEGEGGARPCGLVFDRSSRNDLARRAAALAADPALREALAAAGLDRARSAASPAEEAAALERVYLEALGA